MSQDDRTRNASGLHTDVQGTLDGLGDAEAEELARTWQLAALAADREPGEEAVASALRRFLSMIGMEQASDALPSNGRPQNRMPQRRRDGRRLPRRELAAAALALLIVCAIAVLWPRTTTVTVAPGEIADVTLPDGSHVVVGSSSELTYRSGPFADSRHVHLNGEAFFTVTEDERTFRVETFNATVTALGTSFNVRAPRDSRTPSTRVALATGSVKLIPTGADERAVWLRPGEMTDVGRSGIPTAPRPVSVEAEASWRTGGFVMVHQPLDAIVDELERRYGVVIELKGVGSGSDTLSIRLPKADHATVVMADICALVGCRYQENGTRLTVEPNS